MGARGNNNKGQGGNTKKETVRLTVSEEGERWDSNPRQPEPQSGALPTELRSPCLGLQR